MSDAITSAQSKLAELFSGWTQAKRIYNLSGTGLVSDLMVESFTLVDSISEPFALRLNVLTLDASISVHALLGKTLTLSAALSDGRAKTHSGLVFEAKQLGSDGGFSRLQLTINPWLQLLAHERHSRAWENKTVIEIIDSVLGSENYAPYADWRWGEQSESGDAEDIAAFIARGPNAGVHPLCCQYRESNLHFVQRLLAEHGLGWRVEEAEDAKAGHRVVFFAESLRWPENITSASAVGGAGIRFHASAANSVQEQDAIQALGGQRSLNSAATALLVWDYASKSAVAACAPTSHTFGAAPVQDMASWLEQYEPLGATADTGLCTSDQLQHLAVLGQQAHEFRNKTWLGRSSVRSLRAGEFFHLKNSTLDALSALGRDDTDLEFTVHSVHSLGINNLPKEMSDRIVKSIERSPFDELEGLDAGRPDPAAQVHDSLANDPELAQQAAATGYANRFEACRRSIPWRPTVERKPTSLGMQMATVVGPTGNSSPNGADELYTDKLGRIRVQFHWQNSPNADPREDNRKSCWVRVAQRWAGAGMGHQFIPRIGQEVIVEFVDGDINRPICTGSLYNGRGEGGIPRTPGGEAGETDLTPFGQSNDHRPSAQGNLVNAGHSPAWHGGAPGTATQDANAQNNSAALSGIKSKEFGGEGFNQLVFDDTPGQLRTQLATTQHATQLNLGYLIHQADNHRGHYRGTGFELRTDAYGAVRAAQGLLITSFGARESDPAGDNAAGMALLKQAATLADSFSNAAKTHQTTALASAIGTTRANQSSLSDKLAPMKALHQTASGMVSQAGMEAALTDASKKATQATDGKLPHTTDPIVAITAKAGLATVAGQDIQWASGDVISMQAGQDIQLASGQQMRVHTGQSLGILAGAVQAGQGAKGSGLTMIAGKGPVQMQAQADQAEVAAKNLVNIQTANAHIDWAAAKKITLTTSGGAQIVIGGEGITVQCPGKITVKAATKSFIGGAKEDYVLPVMPKADISWVNLEGRYEDAWNTAWPLDDLKVDINGSTVAKSVTVDMTQEIA
ncbi:MAG: type VI secretion system tip protein VgrG [Rhizobacter sp.]|nr:type VI secretion system tip protein VgrG [Rhizobacter sp.]